MKHELYKVKSIDKAIKMLRLFSAKSPELTLNEMSIALGIHKSSAHRIAVTLSEGGFLKWNSSKGNYSLGLRILELSGILTNNLEIRAQARPNLEQLHKKTNEMVHLAVLDEGNVVYIDKLESKEGIRLYSEIGKRAPCHCTGLGKALLSGLSNEEVRAILNNKGMKLFTSNTIVDIESFLKHLDIIRERGYALDIEEHEPMVHCVAVPIKDYTCKCIAAASVTVITRNIYVDEMLEKYKNLMLSTGEAISSELGYTGKIKNKSW